MGQDSGRGPVRKLLAWCAADIRSGETIDLWLLLASALLFTILGATGVSSVQVLSSVVMALLALLAVSQIRGRRELREQIASWRRGRTEIFGSSFPSDYYKVRSAATESFCFAGMTMNRTLPTAKADLERILNAGGTVRIILPDPEDAPLVGMIAESRGETSEYVARSIRHSLEVIGAFNALSKAQVRLTSMLPRVGLNLIDVERPSGFLMVQMYQVHPKSEAGPIFALSPDDYPWFNHFRDVFEALWEVSRPWAC